MKVRQEEKKSGLKLSKHHNPTDPVIGRQTNYPFLRAWPYWRLHLGFWDWRFTMRRSICTWKFLKIHSAGSPLGRLGWRCVERLPRCRRTPWCSTRCRRLSICLLVRPCEFYINTLGKEGYYFSEANCSSKSKRSRLGGGSSLRVGGNTAA